MIECIVFIFLCLYCWIDFKSHKRIMGFFNGLKLEQKRLIDENSEIKTKSKLALDKALKIEQEIEALKIQVLSITKQNRWLKEHATRKIDLVVR